ncbi:hypothetical protein Hpkin27_06800 [Helicobacter pylori]
MDRLGYNAMWICIPHRLEPLPIDIPNRSNALEHAFYGYWIKGYSSKEFQACVNWNINLLDSLTLASSKQEIEKLKEIFIATSEYEYLFWDMAYQS